MQRKGTATQAPVEAKRIAAAEPKPAPVLEAPKDPDTCAACGNSMGGVLTLCYACQHHVCRTCRRVGQGKPNGCARCEP